MPMLRCEVRLNLSSITPEHALVLQAKGGSSKRGGLLRPFQDIQFDGPDQAPGALPKTRYFSFPTKPNLVTPDALMMFSTWAERS